MEVATLRDSQGVCYDHVASLSCFHIASYSLLLGAGQLSILNSNSDNDYEVDIDGELHFTPWDVIKM